MHQCRLPEVESLWHGALSSFGDELNLFDCIFGRLKQTKLVWLFLKVGSCLITSKRVKKSFWWSNRVNFNVQIENLNLRSSNWRSYFSCTSNALIHFGLKFDWKFDLQFDLKFDLKFSRRWLKILKYVSNERASSDSFKTTFYYFGFPVWVWVIALWRPNCVPTGTNPTNLNKHLFT